MAGEGDPLFLQVKQVEGDLYRIEADEILDFGEYSISPNNSNQVFAFQVY